MCTENEKNVLQLAKKVFEHFTHDALPIAREIIAMEQQLEELPINLPVSDLQANNPDLECDPMGVNQQRNEELVLSPEDSLPF